MTVMEKFYACGRSELNKSDFLISGPGAGVKTSHGTCLHTQKQTHFTAHIQAVPPQIPRVQQFNPPTLLLPLQPPVSVCQEGHLRCEWQSLKSLKQSISFFFFSLKAACLHLHIWMTRPAGLFNCCKLVGCTFTKVVFVLQHLIIRRAAPQTPS